MNINMQDVSDKCEKKFLELAQEKLGDTSTVPVSELKRYCRMLTVYCDSEGKVTDSFIKSMETSINKIIAIDGMKEILDVCNECPED